MDIAGGEPSRRSVVAGIGAAAILPGTAWGQPLPAPAPSTAALKDDVNILREALRLHPGLYRYNTPRTMEDRLRAFAPAYVNAPDQAARYLALALLLAGIRCGHSYPNFYNQKKSVSTDLFDRPTRLPFRFVWIDGQMIVTRDESETGRLKAGSVVVDINGVAPGDMLGRLLPYIRADGHNDAKRRSLLEVRGDDSYETFDVFHGLVYGPPDAGIHHVRLINPTGTPQAAALPPISLAKRREGLGPPAADTDPVWQWQMRADDIALLTMPSWGLYDSKWDWKRWLDERLASLNGAKGLIIDLRNNEGGLDCGDIILARLADRDLHPVGYEQKLRFQRTPPGIDRYLDTWDDSFRTLGVGAAALPGGFFARPNAESIQAIAAVRPRLTLPVALLVGPVNSSATFQFARTAKSNGLARLFGAPTGGNLRGINGGAFFFVRLPGSSLEFDLPLIGFFAKHPARDAGLAPDVLVTARMADIVTGADPVLAKAVGWIRQS